MSQKPTTKNLPPIGGYAITRGGDILKRIKPPKTMRREVCAYFINEKGQVISFWNQPSRLGASIHQNPKRDHFDIVLSVDDLPMRLGTSIKGFMMMDEPYSKRVSRVASLLSMQGETENGEELVMLGRMLTTRVPAVLDDEEYRAIEEYRKRNTTNRDKRRAVKQRAKKLVEAISSFEKNPGVETMLDVRAALGDGNIPASPAKHEGVPKTISFEKTKTTEAPKSATKATTEHGDILVSPLVPKPVVPTVVNQAFAKHVFNLRGGEFNTVVIGLTPTSTVGMTAGELRSLITNLQNVLTYLE